jgi:hypothetical protein
LLLDLAAAAAGMIIGLRFRAGALMAATLVMVAGSVGAQAHGHGFGWHALGRTLEWVVLLQIGYLIGLAVVALWRRFRGK